MEIQIDKTSPVPLYIQIQEQIETRIATGQLGPGDRLPTLQAMATLLGVNINTVALAYRQLKGAGLLVTRRGQGTYVAAGPGMENEIQRDRKLDHLVDRFWREAARLGYRDPEILAAWMRRTAGGE